MKQKVKGLLMESMKAKTAGKTEVYRAILTSFMTAEKESGNENLADAEYTAILRKMVKTRKETTQVYIDNDRDDLAVKEAFEAMVIEELLPQLMNDEQAEEFILKYAKDNNITLVKTNMGVLVKAAIAASNGTLDGKTAAGIVMRNLI